MLILGLESATAQVGCAIGGHEGVLASSHSARGKRHAENLTPAIEFVCRHAQIEITDIGAIGVDIGPGLFTGMRVGIATAKAMAHALQVPVVGVSSLDLLAHPLRHSSKVIASVIDARKGEVFYAFYRPVPNGVQRVTEPRVGRIDDLESARGLESKMIPDEESVITGALGSHRQRDETRGLTIVIEGRRIDRVLHARTPPRVVSAG